MITKTMWKFFEYKRKKAMLDKNSARYVDVCVSCECKLVGIISVYDRVDFDKIKVYNLESVRLKSLSDEIQGHARNRCSNVRDYVYYGTHHHTGQTYSTHSHAFLFKRMNCLVCGYSSMNISYQN